VRWATVVVAAVLALLAGACSSSGETQQSAVDLGPDSLALSVGASQSDFRATIDVTLGGSDVTLLFDTGSVGLSVLSTAVPSDIASLTGEPFQEAFDGGVELSGVIVSVPVTIAGQSTSGPIAIRLVQSASCGSAAPDCPASGGIDSFSASIGADGILGAGFWSSGTVYSPLAQLGSGMPSSMAVYWDGDEGSVTFEPTLSSTPVASLQMPAADPNVLPNGADAWDNQTVSICWQISSSPQTCSETALDTGASAMSFPIGFPGGPTSDVNQFPSGQTITAAASSGATPFLNFTTGSTLGTDLVTVIPGEPGVNSGLQFFNEFIVVFSLTDGQVQLYSPDQSD
jgi:hypothetical protein